MKDGCLKLIGVDSLKISNRSRDHRVVVFKRRNLHLILPIFQMKIVLAPVSRRWRCYRSSGWCQILRDNWLSSCWSMVSSIISESIDGTLGGLWWGNDWRRNFDVGKWYLPSQTVFVWFNQTELEVLKDFIWNWSWRPCLSWGTRPRPKTGIVTALNFLSFKVCVWRFRHGLSQVLAFRMSISVRVILGSTGAQKHTNAVTCFPIVFWLKRSSMWMIFRRKEIWPSQSGQEPYRSTMQTKAHLNVREHSLTSLWACFKVATDVFIA